MHEVRWGSDGSLLRGGGISDFTAFSLPAGEVFRTKRKNSPKEPWGHWGVLRVRGALHLIGLRQICELHLSIRLAGKYLATATTLFRRRDRGLRKHATGVFTFNAD